LIDATHKSAAITRLLDWIFVMSPLQMKDCSQCTASEPEPGCCCCCRWRNVDRDMVYTITVLVFISVF